MGRELNYTSIKDKMKKAREFAEENLKELSKEIVEWKKTGLLCGGTGGCLRELASMLPVDCYSNLALAETMVVDIALEKIVNDTL